MHPHQRLLAVSHEGSRTGAPVVLATLLEWLCAHTDVEIHTTLVKDGELRSRLEQSGAVSAVSDRFGARELELAEVGLEALDHSRLASVAAAIRYRSALAGLGGFDVVLFNSITSLEIQPHVRSGARQVAYIHEGPTTVAQWWGSRSRRLRRMPDLWVAVSDDTAAALHELPDVDPTRVVIQRPFIDVARVRSSRLGHQEVRTQRSTLGIPPGAPIVVGSGSIDRRKGPDLFVQLACEVRRRREPSAEVHFIWVGGDRASPEWPLLQAELRRAGTDHVRVVEHTDNPVPYFDMADVFVLTSREDPFPLVCLESAAVGTPVLAYSSSGIRALLTDSGPDAAEGVIPYMDVGAMASRLLQLIDSPALAADIGSQLGTVVERRHDVSSAAPALEAMLRLRGRPGVGTPETPSGS